MIVHNNIFQIHRKIKQNEYGQIILDKHDMALELGGLLGSKTLERQDNFRVIKTYKTLAQIKKAIKEVNRLYDTSQVEYVVKYTLGKRVDSKGTLKIYVQNIHETLLKEDRQIIIIDKHGKKIEEMDI